MLKLFNIGNNVISISLNFEDIQTSRNTAILINILPNTMQDCLISGTPIAGEEKLINDLLNSNTNQVIIIYGKKFK